MLKRLALIVAILCIPTLAKADSFVSVTIFPEVFHVAGDETVGATFVWDTTTNILSDITVTAAGPFWQGVDHIISVDRFGGGVSGGTLYLGNFDFQTAAGDIYQLNYGNHGETFTPFITDVPGTYLADLWLECPQCATHGSGSIYGDGPGTAIVTSLGDGDHDADDPVSTPEPSSLVTLLAGLAAMSLAIYAKRGSLTTISSFARLPA